MKIDLSFLIPTNKPYQQFAKHVVNGIHEANSYKNKGKYTFEIICYSHETISDYRIQYIKEEVPDGASNASNFLANVSTGKYFITLPDDHYVPNNIFDIIDFLESPIFTGRKFKIATLPCGNNNFTTYAETSPAPFLKKLDLDINLPSFPVPCFPFCSRHTYENHLGGHLFHPQIRYFCDWYLGYYLFTNNEPVIQFNECLFPSFEGSLDFQKTTNTYDHIFKRKLNKYYGISYVNLYRIIKEYKPNLPYMFEIEEITEQMILNKLYHIVHFN